MVDVYNVFNNNATVAEVLALGPLYLDPAAVMPGRLAKFGLQLDF